MGAWARLKVAMNFVLGGRVGIIFRRQSRWDGAGYARPAKLKSDPTEVEFGGV